MCSGSKEQEDPYDSVMRRAANIEMTIIPDSGN